MTDSLQLAKLAFIATAFKQFECAEQCFEAPAFDATPPSQGKGEEHHPQYLDFIFRLSQAVSMLPQREMPQFSDVYTSALSEARFQVQVVNGGTIVSYLKTITPLVIAIRTLRSLRRQLNWLRISAIIYGYRWCRHSGSPVEALFMEFGMTEHYVLAMRNRILDNQMLPAPSRAPL